MEFDRLLYPWAPYVPVRPSKVPRVLYIPLYIELPAFVCSTWLPYLEQTAVSLALIGQFAPWQEMRLTRKSFTLTSSALRICQKRKRRQFSVTTWWNFMDFTKEWIITSSSRRFIIPALVYSANFKTYFTKKVIIGKYLHYSSQKDNFLPFRRCMRDYW